MTGAPVEVVPPGNESLDLVCDGGSQVACAIAGLSDGGGVDVDLDPRLPLGSDVGLEVGRDFDDEQELALVHLRVDLVRRDLNRGLECRAPQSLGDPARQVRSVLVDDADREIGRFGHGAGRDRVDRDAEGIDEEDQHHRVRPDASQLLDHQMEDIGDVIGEGERPGVGEARGRRGGRLRHLTPPACEEASATGP